MFKMDKNILIILIMSILFMFGLTIGNPTATEVQSHSITINRDGTYLYDGTEVEQFILYGAGKAEQYRTYLYLDDGTPVTFRYLLENPDFSIIFTAVQDSELFFNTDFCKNEAGSALGFKNLAAGESVVIDHNVKFKTNATTQTLDKLFGENGLWSQYIDNHIYFFSKHFSDGQTFTLTFTGYDSSFTKLMNDTVKISEVIFLVSQSTMDFMTSNSIMLLFLILSIVFLGIYILFKIKNGF